MHLLVIFSTFTFLIGCLVFYIFVGTPALPLAPEGEGRRAGQWEEVGGKLEAGSGKLGDER